MDLFHPSAPANPSSLIKLDAGGFAKAKGE